MWASSMVDVKIFPSSGGIIRSICRQLSVKSVRPGYDREKDLGEYL